MTGLDQPSADPANQTSSSRNLIIALVVAGVLLLGYCAVSVVRVVRHVGGFMSAMRTDTTHHVAAGSGVYLNTARVAAIERVTVVRFDTTQLHPRESMVDSTMATMFRHGMVIYTASEPTDGALAAALTAGDTPSGRIPGRTLIGRIRGTYDDSMPVQITLESSGPPAAITPFALLQFGVRHRPLVVYPAGTGAPGK